MDKELSALIGPLSAMLLDLYTRQMALTELLLTKGLVSQDEIDQSVESSRRLLDRYPGVDSLRVQTNASALIALEPMLTRPSAQP